MKKLATMAISVGLIGAMVAGGSLAYLSDTASDVNVMTLGNVEIEQIEQQRPVDSKGNPTSDVLVNFKNDKSMMPAVINGPLSCDGSVTLDNGSKQEIWDESVNGEVDKIVTVKNTGKSDAYVRTLFAFEDKILDDGTYLTKQIHTLWSDLAAVEWLMDGETYPMITVDGVDYTVCAFTYKDVLPAGQSSDASLVQMWLDPTADNDFSKIAGEEYNVIALSQAVQAQGFDSAVVALNEGFGAVTKENAQKWFDNAGQGAEVILAPEDAKPVDTLDELQLALADGGNIKLVNDITVTDATVLNVTADTAIYGEGTAALNFEGATSKITVAADTSLALHSVELDANGEYSFDADGNIVYDADARRTTPLLNVGAGSDLTLDGGTTIENVVATGSAVISANGTDSNRATVTIKDATIQNCAGESGTIINVNKASDVFIEEGTVISNNASYNNNNHGIIRVYNAWDAANPSTVTMNGGEISDNYYSGNGMIGLYYGKFIMNDGEIEGNSWFADNQKHNGWYPVVYAHSNSQFVMNGGEICNNTVKYGVINSLNSDLDGALTINGGTITNNIATNNDNKDACAVIISESKNSLAVSKDANVTGTVWIYYDAEGNYWGAYKDISEFIAE